MKQEKEIKKEVEKVDITPENMLWAENMRGRILNIVITSTEVEEKFKKVCEWEVE